jgi:predicted DNA-binding protein
VSTRKDGLGVMVRMPPDLHERIKERAAAEERTMSQAIRFAIKHYLEGCPSPSAR